MGGFFDDIGVGVHRFGRLGGAVVRCSLIALVLETLRVEGQILPPKNLMSLFYMTLVYSLH